MVITLTLVVELTNHVQHSFEAISKNQFAVIVVINKHNVSFLNTLYGCQGSVTKCVGLTAPIS